MKCFNTIRRFFGFKITPSLPEPNDAPSKYSVKGGCWGMNINFMSKPPWSEKDGQLVGRVVGHMPRKPEEGDLLEIPCESSKNAIAVLHNIEYCRDPRDMFFADFRVLGYEENLSELMATVTEKKMTGLIL